MWATRGDHPDSTDFDGQVFYRYLQCCGKNVTLEVLAAALAEDDDRELRSECSKLTCDRKDVFSAGHGRCYRYTKSSVFPLATEALALTFG